MQALSEQEQKGAVKAAQLIGKEVGFNKYEEVFKRREQLVWIRDLGGISPEMAIDLALFPPTLGLYR